MQTALSTQVASSMPSVITPADFSALDNVISKLAAHSGNLSDEEKKQASQVITEWKDLVIGRIESNLENAKEYLAALERPTAYNADIIMELAEALGFSKDVAEYNELNDKMEELRRNSPKKPESGPDDTVKSTIQAQYDYEKEEAIHTRQVRQVFAAMDNKLEAIRRKLCANTDIKELQAKLKKYIRNAKPYKDACVEKAQLARISITIENQEAREVLKELIGFASTI